MDASMPEEFISEPIEPLVAHSHGRREDQRGAIQPPDHLQAQHGLARSGSGDDVQVVVVQIVVQFRQHALLVGAPRLAKLDVRRKCLHLACPKKNVPTTEDDQNLQEQDADESHRELDLSRLMAKDRLCEQSPGTASDQRRQM